ncbi:hypothetical protein [Amycolatopsis palatopharyngis]|uniref:hypothetical protein n=1 Tax=Amycolatopsis palatopharyngis TaxID=187982 RepID=UPI000E256476|nr:hypothetical protein [Amycolatopsis palatopharyngis]
MTLSQAPAGGAAVDQILIAMAMFFGIFLPVAVFVIRERGGRRTLIGRLADLVARWTGLPRWAGLPMGTAMLSGVAALIGVYWDVPTHMELGRDEGPLANPSHYPIYFGLMGIFATGVLSAALAKGKLPVRTFPIGPYWRAPMGSILIMATGLVAVVGFPLDDVWHRLFGQDVTEWGPTHVLMIGGGITVVIGLQLLLAEARQVGATGRLVRWLDPILAGAWMMGASAFLMEFDLGVPQFPMLAQVVLVGLIAGWTLVYARAKFGPGATLIVLAVFLLSRALYAGIPLALDFHVASMLPYVAEAALVEIAALVLRGRTAKPVFALLSGALIGTAGMAAEWAFSQWLMPYPWPAAMLPAIILFGTLAGVSGALIGFWQFQRTEDIAIRRKQDPRPADSAGRRFRARHAFGLAGALGAVGLMAVVVPPEDPPSGLRADIALSPSAETLPISHAPRGSGAQDEPRWADVTITLDRAEDIAVAENSVWFRALAWQGGDFFHSPMRQLSPGVYTTTQPLPVFGEWKSGIRLHGSTNALVDRTMTILPVYAPEDPEASAPLIAAVPGEREFISEISFLQRERKEDTPAILWTVAYVAVGGIFGASWCLYAWLYAAAAAGTGRRGRPARRTAPESVLTP